MSGIHKQHDHAMMLWGHSLSDYREMFDLTDQELANGVLDLGPGPARFNYEATKLGFKVISADELFTKPLDKLKPFVTTEFNEMLQIVKQHEHNFQWTDIPSLEDLATTRLQGMQQFFNDYEQGLQQGRYIASPMDRLPFSALRGRIRGSPRSTK